MYPPTKVYSPALSMIDLRIVTDTQLRTQMFTVNITIIHDYL